MTLTIINFAMAVVVSLVLVGRPSAEAQQPHVARIGVISNGSPDSSAASVEPFRQRLRELGYVEGRNITIEIRYADEVRYAAAQRKRYRDIAAELAGLRVDVIVATRTLATHGAKEVTSTIPIVMVSVGDAVRAGLVTSLGRPGGNITGQSFLAPELTIKGLDLLTEALPRATRVGWLFNPNLTREPAPALGAAVRARGVTLQPLALRRPDDLKPALAAMGQPRPDALLVFAVNASQLDQVVEFAAKNRLPAVYGFREAVDAGGLCPSAPSSPTFGGEPQLRG
jgi:putative ABC transport system substrate-binding protein